MPPRSLTSRCARYDCFNHLLAKVLVPLARPSKKRIDVTKRCRRDSHILDLQVLVTLPVMARVVTAMPQTNLGKYDQGNMTNTVAGKQP